MFVRKCPHPPPNPIPEAEVSRKIALYWEKVAALAELEGDAEYHKKSLANAAWNRQQAREQEVAAEMGIKR